MKTGGKEDAEENQEEAGKKIKRKNEIRNDLPPLPPSSGFHLTYFWKNIFSATTTSTTENTRRRTTLDMVCA
jgi:hypothetical protein